jgi:hypothetical protein
MNHIDATAKKVDLLSLAEAKFYTRTTVVKSPAATAFM